MYWHKAISIINPIQIALYSLESKLSNFKNYIYESAVNWLGA